MFEEGTDRERVWSKDETKKKPRRRGDDEYKGDY